MRATHLTLRYAAATVLAALLLPSAANAGLQRLRPSIVKIYATMQRDDYGQPWQSLNPGSGTGSGFIIKGNRILSNAHVVSDARFIEVEREGDSRRYPAKVRFAAHDCDLAMLEVDDPAFFVGTKPLMFGSELPSLNDEVLVIGFPMGGSRISLTKGVVSRLDYSLYSHSGVDSHLVLQVDAAINPGNSGGPVLFNGKVIGLAFQGIAGAQSLGYAIPLPVINHFLKDVEDDVYDGYPELGVAHMDTRNPALRADLNVADGTGGVAVFYTDPFGAASGLLLPRDVLLRVDGLPIAEDGTVTLDGNVVEYTELVERKQCGEAVRFNLLRAGTNLTVDVPLKPVKDPFMYRYQYDERPEYLVQGGLVFSPLSRGFLATIGPDVDSRPEHRLYYLSHYTKPDGLYTNREQFVVLIGRLPAPVNMYATEFQNQVVDEVNGRPIRSLRDLEAAFKQPTNGFHVMRFDGNENRFVMDAKEARRSDFEISRRYVIPKMSYLKDKDAAP